MVMIVLECRLCKKTKQHSDTGVAGPGKRLSDWGEDLRRSVAHLASPADDCFPYSCFHSVGSGELPISVWFGARSARVQFTNFLDRGTTNKTGHEQYLLQREFLGLHESTVQRLQQ